MTETLSATVPGELAGSRLDQALARMFPQYSRSRLKSWLLAGAILVDGSVRKPRDTVDGGEHVDVRPEEEPAVTSEPEPIELDIAFEDEHLLVVSKPAGLVVHPGAGNTRGTLMNGLLHHDPNLESLPRAGIVHRLDKDTSGVMVVAKTPRAHERLVEMFQAHELERAYLAIAVGRPPQSVTYDTFHGRHPAHRKRFTSRGDRGRRAITHLESIEVLHGSTLVRCRLETGRTHQIRVHLAEHGHPVLGDPLYGKSIADPELRKASAALGRQALHAAVLAFAHPLTAEPMRFETEPPSDFQDALTSLRAP